MKFTAIDFETANADRGSVCSVGLAIVENGKVVKCLHQLIRPVPSYFDRFNIMIHGITEDDVVDAPTFAEYWPTLWSHVCGPLVAHNASFDLSVIRKALDHAAATYPETDYFCTNVIAKLVWPHYPTCALDYVAGSLGIAFRHHNAEEDARACALIALAACKRLGAATLYDLESVCGLRVGRLHGAGYVPCGGPRRGGMLRRE